MSIAYEPVIGLEVHVQLRTRSKLFCPCRVTFGEEPNRQICPVCTGQPGVLPVLNKTAVEYAVRTAIALECEIFTSSVFARKNYFYPDLPKGYQISQYESPLAADGSLEFSSEGGVSRVKIERVHLEEEAGKMMHHRGEALSWVDYNRAGIPLIEIVSEPDIRSPREGYIYLQRLRQVLRYLGVSDVRMEEGNLRCDANVSVRPVGSEEFGIRTELKNMNSFKGVEASLQYEIDRQIEWLKSGKSIAGATLLWDDERKIAVVMRTKEEEEDYRYFPEPDLPPLVIDPSWIETIRNDLPELPWEIERRYRTQYHLPEYDIGVLTSEPELADYFEDVLKNYPDAKVVSNWIMGEVMAMLKSEGTDIGDLNVRPRDLADILTLIDEGIVSGTAAKSVFQEVADTGSSPVQIVNERGMTQISDKETIEEIVERVMSENSRAVDKYLGGKVKVLGYLVGQVMEETGGKANPSMVNEILLGKLKNLRGNRRGEQS
jgi:aspartyl-tRNA(Asn)/glutamyl-tRNA(Gln) amidotransferase subunit B